MPIETVDAGTVCELLAAVPGCLGHLPGPGDVVAIGASPDDDRVPRLVARTDHEVLRSGSGPAVARSIAAHLAAMGCTRALALRVLAADRDRVADSPLLSGACTAAGLDWDGTWALGPEWIRRCPDGPRLPRELLAGTAAAERDRALGREPAARRADLGVIPVAGPGDRRAAAEGRLRWTHRRPRPGADDPGPVWGDWQRASLRRWCDGLDRPESVRRGSLGRIEAGLTDAAVVEASALAVLAGRPGGEGPPSWERGGEGSGCGGADGVGPTGTGQWERVLVARLAAPWLAVPLGAVPVPGTGPGAGAGPGGARGPEPVTVRLRPWLAQLLAPATVGPDRSRTDAAIRLLTRVLGHGRRTGQSGALTLLGLFTWWRGEGVRAAVLVDRALADRPVDPLAAQLDWLLSAGALPGWARVGGTVTGGQEVPGARLLTGWS